MSIEIKQLPNPLEVGKLLYRVIDLSTMSFGLSMKCGDFSTILVKYPRNECFIDYPPYLIMKVFARSCFCYISCANNEVTEVFTLFSFFSIVIKNWR